MLVLKVRLGNARFMRLLINQGFAETLQVISFKNDLHPYLLCTSCTDNARVKVTSLQKVIFFYNMKYSTETPSICIFVCLKVFLTAVIEVEHASNDLLHSDSSLLLRNSMKTNTTSSYFIEIQNYACKLLSNFALLCTPYYMRHGLEIFGDVSVAQLVASMSGVVLRGVVMVVDSNLARGKIFTASISSVDSLYISVFIYCMNLHQFLILCSSKAMMFVKLYFRNYVISLDPSGFHLRTK